MRRAEAPRLPTRARVAVLVAAAVAALAVVVARTGSWTLVLPADVADDDRQHGTWREMFDLHGLASAIPLPLWLLALVALTVVGFPYVWLTCRALPDRGYAVSRTVGLLLVAWLAWWCGSLRMIAFGRLAIWLSLLVLAAGALAIVARHRHELASWLSSHWRLVLLEEGVFWALFALTLYVRWSNPDLWHPLRGGEKPMDLAYLNAVSKSASFPPYDPWFAGGAMNYYYFGFVQVASLAKLTAIAPATAYNLAIPTLVAMLGTASFGAGLAVAPRAVAGGARLAVAGLTAVFVTVAGNLGEVRVLRSALEGTVPNDWWFWNASRSIRPGPGEPGPITEFPAFTYIYGDLHAHAMALPVAVLVLVLVVALVRDRAGPISNPALLALAGLGLGALWVMNTWDLPTYSLVVVGALLLCAPSPRRSLRSLAATGIAVAAVLAVAYVSFLPFHLHYEGVFDGVARWRGRRTGLTDFVVVHGLFLFAIVSGLLAQIAFARDLGSPARAVRLRVRHWDRIGRVGELGRALVRPRAAHTVAVRAVPAVFVAAAVLAAFGHWPAGISAAVAVLCALAWPVRRRRESDEYDVRLRRLLILWVLVGLVLAVSVEYLVLRNIDVGRTNTVFKLYLQVWVLWAIAAAVSVGTVYARLPSLPRWLRECWRLAFVALVAAALLYPVLAARAKSRDRFDPAAGRSLDGTAFMRTAVFTDRDVAMPLTHDRDAMRWMLAHVDGSPVVAEANTFPTLYGWELRYAMFTGNPAIVGWDYHQRQQRPAQSPLVTERIHDVQELYETDDAGAAYRTLRRYGASYAVVGPLERAYFPHGTAKWERGRGRYWTLAYANPGVRLYRVLPSTR